ncbi:MAG: 50S ribosomal protein L15 [Planctomycetes bacterium]|nr:50S ribosomal protein L15 [Planctomycetota bacterium]
MNITQITQLAGKQKSRKRVGRGRGSGMGKTCGRGHKGQNSRPSAGGRMLNEGGQMPTFRRIPKRGFSNAKFRTRFSTVNVSKLEERFETGAHVTPQALLEVGLIRNLRFPIKILGDGELKKKLTVDAAKYTGTAKDKIEKAGGEARIA